MINNILNIEKRNGFHIFSNIKQKRNFTDSLEKIFQDNSNNKIISDEQINENIKQCYHNLKNLRNVFRGKKNNQQNNNSKHLEINKYDNSKSSIIYSKETNNSKDNSIRNLNLNITNKNNINNVNSIQHNKLSNSIKNPFKNTHQLTLSQDDKINKYNKTYNSISDKSLLLDRSLSNKSNSNFNLTIGDTIYNNQLLFSHREKIENDNSIKDNYISFLQKQLDESGKKNKELIQMYKEIEKKCENLIKGNKVLNNDLNYNFKKDDLIYKEIFKTDSNISNNLSYNIHTINNQNNKKNNNNNIISNNTLNNTLNNNISNNEDDSLILLKSTNEELRKNLLLMTNKFSENHKSNFIESEINILKEKNEILSKNLKEKENIIKEIENKKKKIKKKKEK